MTFIVSNSAMRVISSSSTKNVLRLSDSYLVQKVKCRRIHMKLSLEKFLIIIMTMRFISVEEDFTKILPT